MTSTNSQQMPLPAMPTTPDKANGTRRMLLLEARLAPTTPITPSKTPNSASGSCSSQEVTPGLPVSVPQPSAISGAPAPLIPIENSESVHSFSSDGVQLRTAPISPSISVATPAPGGLQPSNPVASSAPSSGASVGKQQRRKASAGRPAKAGKKRKQSPMGPSPARQRNGRVDEFFKSVTPPKTRRTMANITRTETVPTATKTNLVSSTVMASRVTDPAANGEIAPSANDLGCDAGDPYGVMRRLIDKLSEENAELRETAAEVEDLRAENEDLQAQVSLELPDLREKLAKATTSVQTLRLALKETAIEGEQLRRRVAEQSIHADGDRLGRTIVARGGVPNPFSEVWQDGFEWRALENRLTDIAAERTHVEKQRREAAARRREKGGVPTSSADGTLKLGTEKDDDLSVANDQDELWRARLLALKRTETSLLEQRARLARERDTLVRELRRQNDERASDFGECPTLNRRYVLLNLLGRGGFSEVFRAVDLETGSTVACKIHQLASNWSVEKKNNFIRHAMREYEIHKALDHPRVVRMLDIFEIDDNAFCTVLQFCDGCDLDAYLRAHKTLPEREARAIIAQVFAGLRYLSEPGRRIIHYDLKPGNILLRKGDVQITDFGLSKIMGAGETTRDGMELTSQGAGTMWYLPPECFEPASKARISSKVDVWSAGVILFQMLYGRKPFGHDQTQERIFRERTVLKEELEFPSKPPVSDLAKDFIRKCLTRQASERPDVRQIMTHPFLRRA